VFSGRCQAGAGSFLSGDASWPIRTALSLASLFALSSFLIAIATLIAYPLDLVDILRPLADGPAVHPLTSVSVILLCVCVVLAMQHTRRLVDGVCAVVLLSAVAQLASPDMAGRWLQENTPIPALPGTFVPASTAFCLLLLAISLLLRRRRNAVVSQILCVFAYGAPTQALVGYVLGVPEPRAGMSLTTVLMLIPLCVATALRTVHHGFLRALLGRTRVSMLARRHLALVMMVPYLLGLGIVAIRPDAANIFFVILIVASSQTVGLIVAMLTLSFGNLERRSNILQKRAESRARRDGLTGAMNRPGFIAHARLEIDRRRNNQAHVSLLFVDIDHFKRINDTWGHAVGDKVLRRIIRLSRGCLRSGDTIARWGGEEFVVLLPATNLDGAVMIAEKIRVRIEAEQFDELAIGLHVTVSVGCAEMNGSEGLDDLVAKADRGLYEAKHRGRNRSVAAKQGKMRLTSRPFT
jgi:diguanylate cyclase (GGDEF)-like protein